MEYLALPFVIRKGFLNKTDLYDSITNTVGLILSTRKGSLPFDPEFGCDLWEKEFSDLFMANRSELQGSIRSAIDIYEGRLFNVSVSLINIDSGPEHPIGIAVKVIGNYKDDTDEKRFEEIFSIG